MLPKTKPADVDVLNWWDKTIEMCTKRADGIEMCIDDLATAVREQRQTIQELRLSLKILPVVCHHLSFPPGATWTSTAVPVTRLEITKDGNVGIGMVVGKEGEIMHGEQEYGLPDLPETAYAQEFDGRWGVWVHALPFCISLALSCESKEAAVAHAQGDWKRLLARHPEYAGQDPIIVQLQPTVHRSWWARAILASRRWLAQHRHL